jgi:hypothetical protein
MRAAPMLKPARLVEETAEQEDRLRELSFALEVERVRNRTMAEEIDNERRNISALRAEHDRLREYSSNLERRHAAVLDSTTWRVMEPVRRLLRLLRRQAGLKQFRPVLAPKAGGSKAAIRRRLENAYSKARRGFPAAGLAEIEAIRLNPRAGWRDRHFAERYATLLWANSPEAEKRVRALASLDVSKAWQPAAAATLRLSLLQSLGLIEECMDLVVKPPAAAQDHPDFLLLAAAVEPSAPARLAAISAAFAASAGSGIASTDPAGPICFDNLTRADAPQEPSTSDTDPETIPKISVIIPAFNCADTIHTSLRSICEQTWRNLEILVVDDASTDDTADRVATFTKRDGRIRLIRLEENVGAYAARNTALAAASGDLVTCQDADDWSHPERLQRQAEHLAGNAHLIANASHWARATTDLRFERRPFSARVVHFNSSSIMFHRERVLERVGFWDSVRFGADTEFWHRLRATFGEEAVSELPLPLAIGRIREDSLSRASASAHVGGKVGARRVYELAYQQWHGTAEPAALRLSFPLQMRPFAVPEVMRTGRSRTGHFDVVLISDFRHVGGTTSSNQQELIAQARAGLRTAVVQVDRYDFNVSRGVHPSIQGLIDAGHVEQLVYGDKVSCDLAIVRFPPIFSHRNDYLPEVRPKAVRVVVNQPPRRTASEAPFYSVETCKTNVAAYLGQTGDWVPIGPAVRGALAADAEGHHLSPEDWFNIIDVDAWAVPRSGWCDPERPVIGRHGRDAPEKWMTRAEDLLGAYPADAGIAVRIMGGADIPSRIIGRQPANWEVLPFNAKEPRDFLAEIDFFVFFPHEERIEAFGRTVIEAMASGCLAILPPVFRPLFGDAALYCVPAEVPSLVHRFRSDQEAYRAQTARAEAIVRQRFGFEQHLTRLERSGVRLPLAAGT